MRVLFGVLCVLTSFCLASNPDYKQIIPLRRIKFPQDPVEISKYADPSYVSDWDWSEKSVDYLVTHPMIDNLPEWVLQHIETERDVETRVEQHLGDIMTNSGILYTQVESESNVVEEVEDEDDLYLNLDLKFLYNPRTLPKPSEKESSKGKSAKARKQIIKNVEKNAEKVAEMSEDSRLVMRLCGMEWAKQLSFSDWDILMQTMEAIPDGVSVRFFLVVLPYVSKGYMKGFHPSDGVVRGLLSCFQSFSPSFVSFLNFLPSLVLHEHKELISKYIGGLPGKKSLKCLPKGFWPARIPVYSHRHGKIINIPASHLPILSSVREVEAFGRGAEMAFREEASEYFPGAYFHLKRTPFKPGTFQSRSKAVFFAEMDYDALDAFMQFLQYMQENGYPDVYASHGELLTKEEVQIIQRISPGVLVFFLPFLQQSIIDQLVLDGPFLVFAWRISRGPQQPGFIPISFISDEANRDFVLRHATSIYTSLVWNNVVAEENELLEVKRKFEHLANTLDVPRKLYFDLTFAAKQNSLDF